VRPQRDRAARGDVAVDGRSRHVIRDRERDRRAIAAVFAFALPSAVVLAPAV